MKTALLALAAAGLIATGSACAQSGAEVFKSKGCVNCHDVSTKKVGPSLQDIAAKHKGAKDEAQLMAKLKEGKGHMKINASDAEIKAAVDYALAGGK